MAEIVHRIYNEYLNGASKNQIAKGLMNDCILSPIGNKKCHKTTILSMLKNEKYFEYALMMKTYKTYVLSKTRIKN